MCAYYDVYVLMYCIGIWSLHCGADDSDLDNTLVVSFVGQTT